MLSAVRTRAIMHERVAGAAARHLMDRDMPRRFRWMFSLALPILLLLVGGTDLHSTAHAQIRVADAPALTDEIETLLRRGSELEKERRWGEAVTHWEDALRAHPDHLPFKHRKTIARIHWNLGRRYADTSFTRLFNELSERQALDLYYEVLTKLQTHYVTNPQWNDLVYRGPLAFDLALTDPVFVKQHLQDVPQAKVLALRRGLRKSIVPLKANSRTDARNIVWRAARLSFREAGLKPSVVILEYVCGAIGGLDKYSTYLSSAQLDDIYSQIDGNFVGLGIELKADKGSLLIVSVISGSPAAEAGLHGGDRIVAVDGKSTREVSTDKAADMLKGTEGSVAELVVTGEDGERRKVQVRRARVEVPSVEDVKIVDAANGIGYFRISSFQKTTSRDVDAALWSLHRQGMRSLIVDVRGNPGGLLTAAVDVADKFVNEGRIVSTRGRSAREDFDYNAHQVGTWRVPLVVLIDKDSASASEIFAGAIADHQRGDIVGEKSYGKGSVQGIFPLSTTGAGLRLTTAKFYSPSGRAISNRGIDPNVTVRTAAKPTADGQPLKDAPDAILNAAVATVKQRLSRRGAGTSGR